MNDEQEREIGKEQVVKSEIVPVEEHSKDDEVAKKAVYSLCYVFGILFFLPLILYKDGESKRHANEGLVLLLFTLIGNAVFGIFMGFGGFVGRLFGIVASVYSVMLLLLGIVGIVYVITERRKPVPVLGSIKLIK
ncbi:MAG: hypothetical protein K2M95_03620 [Clostridiales bacterium]|nr:hypothetical protein [Clostridiales bacterium]